MESTQNLKRRMRSVQNIGQITKAMELVAATKMRRAQELALHSRPYAYTALGLLGLLSGLKDVAVPEILRPRAARKTAFLLMASDRGLAGSFNSSVFREFEHYIKMNGINVHDGHHAFIAIGQKARVYLEHRGMPIAASFNRVGDFTQPEEAEPIADFLIDGYIKHDFDRVIAVFTTFVTALRQDAVAREFLPIDYTAIKQSIEETIPRAGRYSGYAKDELALESVNREYKIEPSPDEVFTELAPRLLKIRMYHAILEANASEHSARRVAMKNASDNASELSEDLTIIYNKSRQAAITNQIIEVTSGSQSIES